MSETIDEPRFDPVIERTLLITRLSELAGSLALSAFEFVSDTESVQLISGISAVPGQDGETTGQTMQVSVLYYAGPQKHLAKTIGFPHSGVSTTYDLHATQSSIENCALQRNALQHAATDAVRRYYLDRAIYAAEIAEAKLHTIVANEYLFNVDLQFFRNIQV